MTATTAHSVTLPVGVVVIREDSDHPWQDHSWRPYGVIVGAPTCTGWKELRRGEGWIQYHAATLLLELHRKETEGYRENLMTDRPSIYVVMSENDEEDAQMPFEVDLVTASAFEAQDYCDSGEEIVEAIDMPEQVKGWIGAFVDEHHVEEKFKKRKRDKLKIEDHKFGQEPIFELRKRMARAKRDD